MMLLEGDRSLIQYGADVNIVFDGDSITAGDGSSGAAARYPYQVTHRAPINGTLTSWDNVAVSGHRWHNGDEHGVDEAYVDGRLNILVPWFGTNDIFLDGLDAVQTAQEARRYIAKRLVAHPDWHIVLMTILPRFYSGDQEQCDTLNGIIDTYNADLRANFRAWGARAFVDNRLPGSYFDFATYEEAEFEKAPGYFYVDKVHLSDAGYAYLAGVVARQLRRLGRD